MSSIPLDVVEEIITALYTMNSSIPDYPTIRACSLVCHEFLPICQKYLFSSIHLDSGRTSWIRHQQATPKQLQSLLSTSPALGSYIRDLTYHTTSGAQDFPDPTIFHTFYNITRLLSLSIHVSVLDSENMDLWNTRIRPVFLPLLQLPTLTSLGLGGIYDFSFADISAYVSLKTITIGNVSFSHHISPTVHLRPHKLVFNRPITHGQLKYLIEAKCADGKHLLNCSDLSTLSVGFMPKDVPDIRQLLEMSHHLVELYFRMDIRTDFSAFNLQNIPAIQQTRTLKQLNFKLIILRPPFANSMDTFVSELEKLAHRNAIESIVISTLISSRVDCTSEGHWKRLDDVLGHSGWSSLRSVSLKFGIDQGNEELVKAFTKVAQTQFPLLSSSNSVKFKIGIGSLCEW
ncbi:hypothetical protein BDN70DRAFT_998468 [Pholiota conissans]|uniref:Uncharacterized protein n=1 Tax=Pholiota conissans TaxID=109636 RepID=A0A9P6CS68_9AGAR|nr:hypothetical protein BDN70DRAFT_998468 [Pholiota conissans]